jgi:hypothetical protein
MSKLRSVSTAFWSDPFIEDLTPNEKLLFLYLITNDKTNMLGIYEVSIKKISFDTGLNKETIEKSLKEFQRLSKVKYIKNHIVLVNFMKHQNYNTNMKKSAIDIYNELPNELKDNELNISKEDPIKGFESLLNHYGMVSKYEAEYEAEYKDEVQDKPKEEKTPAVNWEGLLNQFNEITGKKAKVVDDKTKKQFLARLKDGYTKNDIVNAITNCYNSEFHKSNGHKNLTLEFISRPDKFAMYFDFKEKIVKPQIKNDRL